MFNRSGRLLRVYCVMNCVGPLVGAVFAAQAAVATVSEVTFLTDDGAKIFASRYGKGSHAVILLHGAAFNKQSWDVQARELANHGYQVLAVDFRGYGQSTQGHNPNARYQDVLAAVRFMRAQGSQQVSVVGASMGGQALGRAALEGRKGEMDQMIFLAPPALDAPQKIQGNKLFIVSRGERRRREMGGQFDKLPPPKRLLELKGNAHAQHVFKTNDADTVVQQILRFLSDSRSY